MTKLLIAALLFSSASAFALGNSLNCSNANGTIQYESVQLIMGVPPREGEKRSWSFVNYNGQKLEDVSVQFTNLKDVIKPKRTKTTLTKNYTAVLQVENGVLDVEIKDLVICKQSTYVGPPVP